MSQFQMRATLTEDKKLVFDNSIPQSVGEHLTTGLTVVIPKQFGEFDFYLEFLLPSSDKTGQKRPKYLSKKLEQSDEDSDFLYFNFEIENFLLRREGRVHVQLLAQSADDETILFRSQYSAESAFCVTQSIKAAEVGQATNDYFSAIAKKVTEADQKLNEAQQKIEQVQEIGEFAQQTADNILELVEQGHFDGQNATFEIGNVSTISPTDAASVTNVGSQTHAVLDFEIPKGETGERGEKGDKGDKGEKGDSTATSWGLIEGDLQDQVDLKQTLDNLIDDTDMLEKLSQYGIKMTGRAMHPIKRGDMVKGKIKTKTFTKRTVGETGGLSAACVTLNPAHTMLAISAATTTRVHDISQDPSQEIDFENALYGGSKKCRFSPDGRYLVVPSTNMKIVDFSTTPYTVHTFTSGFSIDARGSTFSPDGKMFVGTSHISPYALFFDMTSPTFEKIDPPPDLPQVGTTAACFSNDGKILALGHTAAPYLTFYDTTTTPYTKLESPAVVPTAEVTSLTYRKYENHLLVTAKGSPVFSCYDTSQIPYTKMANPSSQISSYCYDTAISGDETFVAVGAGSSPYLHLYDMTTVPYTKMSNPSSLPSGIAASCTISSVRKRLFVAVDGVTSIWDYDIDYGTEMEKTGQFWDQKSNVYCQAAEDLETGYEGVFYLRYKT